MTRYDIINRLITAKNYSSYLEIGTQHGNCFTKINAPYKVCVDPEKCYSGLTHHMTSDEFFDQNKETFDIIFVDGLHTEDQCFLDIKNALTVLNANGAIVVHDCLPHSEDFTQICHSGTVYKAIIQLRCTRDDLKIHTVDADCGCAIITFGKSSTYNKVPLSVAKEYVYYAQHKQELMNIISPSQFIQATS